MSKVGSPIDKLKTLSKLIPSDRYASSVAFQAAFESDGLTAFSQRPLAVVIPETIEEVVAIVRWCRDHEVPFVARGSGTSLSGGSLPIADGIVIALNRINHILSLDPQQRTAVVEPGVINIKVSQRSSPHGLTFAPDPSSQTVCTIGGNLAFNAGGAHCLKYGMTSNHVLGLKAVLGNGETVEFGSQSCESIEPDYSGLFCGSEGVFGIATEITLRLQAKPECFHTVLVGYQSLSVAGDAVSAVIESGLLPGAMEIMDALSIEAVEAAVGCGYPKGCEAVLIVELEGPRERVEFEKHQLDAVLRKTQSFSIHVAETEAERLRIWKGRKAAFSAAGRISPDFLVQDGVVPRKRLGEALTRIQQISRESGIRVANVFHAGDGNLHPMILYDGNREGELHRAEQVCSRIIRVCIEMGGSVTGEHGIGMEKREYLPEMFDPPTMALFHRIREAFDPQQIANRGKMFPDAEAPSLSMRGLHPLEKQGLISRE
ncbi:FAD-binding oxidoreductase [Novipirellula artificiosorum]|uniref:Putative FAD-linked oxidoreductase n=1 Tax=Novipirellula artificiosorum TaxID=2528016 RepID=A0A5C6DDC4_9BACT|nr:FAD-linked oxidase C-terminal domain-containing protein [Novipirellula artificiosorum]TWU33691.1 putative FAD-linked oxidoreductase [Novipirellula artificiosorum]